MHRSVRADVTNAELRPGVSVSVRMVLTFLIPLIYDSRRNNTECFYPQIISIYHSSPLIKTQGAIVRNNGESATT